MNWLKNWWWLLLVLIIGGAIGWGLGDLLIAVIDKRIQQAMGG